MKKTNLHSVLITFFILFGLAVSLYLAYSYSRPESFLCVVAESSTTGSCDTVRLSPYSSLFGISVPYYGVAYFAGLLFLWVFKAKLNLNFFANVWVLIYLLLGIIAELYFAYILIFVLNAFCIWCFFIGLSIFSLFILYLVKYFKVSNTLETTPIDD